jgi:hypothetical protein
LFGISVGLKRLKDTFFDKKSYFIKSLGMKKCGISVDLQFVDRVLKKCSEKKFLQKKPTCTPFI